MLLGVTGLSHFAVRWREGFQKSSTSILLLVSGEAVQDIYRIHRKSHNKPVPNDDKFVQKGAKVDSEATLGPLGRPWGGHLGTQGRQGPVLG